MSSSWSMHWVLRDGDAAPDPQRCMEEGTGKRPTLSFDSVSQWLLSCSDDLAPYPPCTEKHTAPLHTYLVAVSHEDGKAGSDGVQKEESADCASVMGVIGVAWVDLSFAARMPANAVQGYLQVVMVRRPFRRLGVADRLLSFLFTQRDRTQITAGPCCHVRAVGNSGDDAKGRTDGGCATTVTSTCSTRATGTGTLTGGTTAVARPIASWMLHTMSPDSVATRAYLKHRITKAWKDGNSVAEPEASVRPSPASVASQVESDLETVKAVTAMYAKRGFVERRRLYRYYGNLADATEMIKNVERSYKAARHEA